VKLIIFDIEGVVFDDYYVLHVAKNLGPLVFFKFLLYATIYKLRIIDVEDAFKKIYRSFRGAPKSVFINSYSKLKKMDGWEQTAEVLIRNGNHIAFVSIGFPTFLLRKLAKEIHAETNLVFGVDLEFIDGHFSGNISGEVTNCDGKASIVESMLTQLNFTKQNVVTVSNDRNNACMFEFADLNIGFKPDLLLRRTADVLVGAKDIELILPYIIKDYELKERETPIKLVREVKRQLVHMSGFFAVFLWTVSPLLCYNILISLIVAYIFSESLRMDGLFIFPVERIVQSFGRKEELHLFALNPLYLAIGILLPLLLFVPPISYVAVTVLVFGDSISTIVGIKLGHHHIPYNKKKSFEGSISGFIVASIVSSFFVSPIFAIIAALSGMIIESLPLPFNDNSFYLFFGYYHYSGKSSIDLVISCKSNRF
jgi:dolichol kinase/phosphoserine phosphatase